MMRHFVSSIAASSLLLIALLISIPAQSFAKDLSGDKIIENVQDTYDKLETLSATFRHEFVWDAVGESEISEFSDDSISVPLIPNIRLPPIPPPPQPNPQVCRPRCCPTDADPSSDTSRPSVANCFRIRRRNANRHRPANFICFCLSMGVAQERAAMFFAERLKGKDRNEVRRRFAEVMSDTRTGRPPSQAEIRRLTRTK